MAMDPRISLEAVAKIRRPAVAGYFYPALAAELRQEVVKLCGVKNAPQPAHAVIVPHGSFSHSGALAARALSQTVIPKRCIILGPSHTGSFMPWSIMGGGWYRTPLGDIPVDAALSESLRSRCAFLEVDAWAQKGEHAIEAILPFLQHCGPEDLTIVPIVTGSDDEAQVAHFAEALAQVIRMIEEPVLLIGSANLSHYESRETVAALDESLIQRIRRFDALGLMRLVREQSLQVCGASTIATVLMAAQALGAVKTEQLGYTTSAEAGGDPDSAIGFAGIRVI